MSNVEQQIRTDAQRKSMHLYCTQLAKELNDASVTYSDVMYGKANKKINDEFKRISEKTTGGHIHPFDDGYIKGINFVLSLMPSFDAPWTQHTVKYELWKRIQVVITGKSSSTEPSPAEYITIFESLNLKMSEWGVYVPWPTQQEKEKQHA